MDSLLDVKYDAHSTSKHKITFILYLLTKKIILGYSLKLWSTRNFEIDMLKTITSF